MKDVAKVGGHSQDKFIRDHTASNGETFAIYQCFDLMNTPSYQAFPYMGGQKPRRFPVAKADSEAKLPKLIEYFLESEAKHRQELADKADPVFEAFKKGKRDAGGLSEPDSKWLESASEDERDAYLYAFKNSKKTTLETSS